MRTLLAALAVVAGSTQIAAAQTTPGWPDFVRAVDAYVQAEGMVGATAALVREGQVVARHHVGLADRATGRRVDDHTIFHWASITKTLGAVAVMQRHDRDGVSLDAPIVRWVPELRRIHDPYGMMDSISLRMLLSHTAGFRAGTWPWGNGTDWEPFEPTEWSQLVAMMPYHQLAFRPGSRYGYSNPGYVYLARVVEAQSGDPWATYIQKQVWMPLGMTRSYVGSTPPFLAAERGHGYAIRDIGGRDSIVDLGADFDPGITIPNSGWNAQVDDVARWAAFLMGRPTDAATRARYESVLPRAVLEQMWAPVAEATQGYTAGQEIGLGFFLLRRGDHRVVGHTGDQGGYRSFLYVDPTAGTAVILSVNTTRETGGDPEAWGRLIEAGVGAL